MAGTDFESLDAHLINGPRSGSIARTTGGRWPPRLQGCSRNCSCSSVPLSEVKSIPVRTRVSGALRAQLPHEFSRARLVAKLADFRPLLRAGAVHLLQLKLCLQARPFARPPRLL